MRLSVIIAFPLSVTATGWVHIINRCSIPVWYAWVPHGVSVPMAQLPVDGYSNSFASTQDGVSIKLSPTQDGEVTQFEFACADGKVNYDISNIDGNPFAAQDTELAPSQSGMSDYPTCQKVSCPAGNATCTAAYNQPDDVRTMVCPDSVDLTFTLCPESLRQRAVAAHGHKHHPRLGLLTARRTAEVHVRNSVNSSDTGIFLSVDHAVSTSH